MWELSPARSLEVESPDQPATVTYLISVCLARLCIQYIILVITNRGLPPRTPDYLGVTFRLRKTFAEVITSKPLRSNSCRKKKKKKKKVTQVEPAIYSQLYKDFPQRLCTWSFRECRRHYSSWEVSRESQSSPLRFFVESIATDHQEVSSFFSEKKSVLWRIRTRDLEPRVVSPDQPATVTYLILVY